MRDPEDVAYIAQLHAELAAAKAKVERLRALCAKFMDCWRNDWMSKEEEAEFDAAGRGEETK